MKLGAAAEDKDVELPGLADEAAFVIGLPDRADPEPVGTVPSRTDLAVLLVLGVPKLKGADPSIPVPRRAERPRSARLGA